jgi:hypothetical protein
MKAYWWKTGDWVGFVCAKNLNDLYFIMDEQVDATECEFIPAKGFLASWKDLDEDSSGEDLGMEYDITTDRAPDLNDRRWKKLDFEMCD